METQEIIKKPCPDCGQEMDGGSFGAGVSMFYCPTCRQIKFLVGNRWVVVALTLKTAAAQPKG